MSLALSKSPTYQVERTFFVHDVWEKMHDQVEVFTEEFGTDDDPSGVKWKLGLRFNYKGSPGLGVYLYNLANRDVVVIRKCITATSASGNEIASDFGSCLHGKRGEESSKSGWRLIVEEENLPRQPLREDFKEYELEVSIAFRYVGRNHDDDREGIDEEQDELRADLLRLMNSGDCADITFIVGDVKIPSHKLILSARSAYFKNMFGSGMREAERSEVIIKNVDAEIFRHLIKYLYCGRLPRGFAKVAAELLPVADQYQHDLLKMECAKQLLKSLNKENVLSIVVVAYMHDCYDLKAACFKMINENMEDLKKHPNWKDVVECHGLGVDLLLSKS